LFVWGVYGGGVAWKAYFMIPDGDFGPGTLNSQLFPRARAVEGVGGAV